MTTRLPYPLHTETFAAADLAEVAEIAVVIPCYRVGEPILALLARIGPEVAQVFVVDDGCPFATGALVEARSRDPRVQVLRHERNLGVGAAVMSGYRAALTTPARVIVKLDGDGQMDPELIPQLVGPLLGSRADYVKGNRFHSLGHTKNMPLVRLIGNAGLSFLTKLSTGYWQVFDPTNGFTAVHRNVLELLPLDRIAKGYFFESDMLYQLGQMRAVVLDMPMRAVYGGATSSLKPLAMLLPFLYGNLRNFGRRVLYSYFLRGFSVASLELLIGTALLLFGLLFGASEWWRSASGGVPATAGTVMLAGLPIIVGMQLVLSWINFDVVAEPRIAISSLRTTRLPTVAPLNPGL